jgi:hypothetical protein
MRYIMVNIGLTDDLNDVAQVKAGTHEIVSVFPTPRALSFTVVLSRVPTAKLYSLPATAEVSTQTSTEQTDSLGE